MVPNVRIRRLHQESSFVLSIVGVAQPGRATAFKQYVAGSNPATPTKVWRQIDIRRMFHRTKSFEIEAGRIEVRKTGLNYLLLI